MSHSSIVASCWMWVWPSPIPPLSLRYERDFGNFFGPDGATDLLRVGMTVYEMVPTVSESSPLGEV